LHWAETHLSVAFLNDLPVRDPLDPSQNLDLIFIRLATVQNAILRHTEN
jgi:hypothetical protein